MLRKAYTKGLSDEELTDNYPGMERVEIEGVNQYYYEDNKFRMEPDLSNPDGVGGQYRIFDIVNEDDQFFLELSYDEVPALGDDEFSGPLFRSAKSNASRTYDNVFSNSRRGRRRGNTNDGGDGSALTADQEGAKILNQLKRDPVHNAYFRLLSSLGITDVPGSLGAYFLVGPLDVLGMISSYKKAAWQVFTEEKYIRSRPIRRRQTPLERMGTPGPRDKESVRPQVIYNRMARTNHLLLELTRRGATGMRRLNGDFLSPPE